MDPQNLRLQRVQFRCGLPRTPIFSEKAGSIVKQRLSDYADWVDLEPGFGLSDDEQKIRVGLFPDSVWADVESLTEEKLERFFNNILGLLATVFGTLDIDSVQRPRLENRFLFPAEELNEQQRAGLLGEKLGQSPPELVEKFGSDVERMVWAIVLPYGELSYAISVIDEKKRDLEDDFPRSFEECGEGGFRIDVNFGLPYQRESASLDELRELFRAAKKESYGIALIFAKYIAE